MFSLLVHLAGCTDPAQTPDPEPSRVPTWNAEVAPILRRECAACHRRGGIAPMPLVTYEEAAAYATAIATATEERRMPPFNLDNSGTCNTYEDAPWLSDEEIATIGAWARGGTPRGEPSPVPPEESLPRELDRVDLTVAMDEAYTPDAAADDDYRCFVLDPGLTEDQFLTGFQVRLGAPQMVHHLTLFALDSPEADAEAAALDAAEPGPGYTCWGNTIVESRWLVGQGPADGGGRMPAGTGVRMRAGRKTVLQMHYNRLNGASPDRTAVDLTLEPTVERELVMKRVATDDLFLPPGEEAVEQTEEIRLRDDFTVWGVWPHMHNLGTRLNVTATGQDGEQCLAQVNRWAFHWQGFAFYEAPVALSAGDTLRITCTYDTTSRDTPTVWGEGTDEEMCIGFFYVADSAGEAGPRE